MRRSDSGFLETVIDCLSVFCNQLYGYVTRLSYTPPKSHVFAVASLRRVHTVCCTLRRLSETSEGGVVDDDIISSLVSAIRSIEEQIMASGTVVEDVALFQIRHPEARAWHDLPADSPDIWIWGRCVELLWEVVMRDKREDNGLNGAWDELTSRLILWNAMSSDSDAGEWVRKETIRQMKML